MARPLMAQKLVEIAKEEGAFYIAHGCTGKGNDQVRFETAVHALDPSIKIIAPWRMDAWEFQSREDLIEYSKDHDIPISQSTAKIYSRDENIWHISHEGGELENPWNEHYDSIHVLSVPPEKAPDEVFSLQVLCSVSTAAYHLRLLSQPFYVLFSFSEHRRSQVLLRAPPSFCAPSSFSRRALRRSYP